jgi:ADP-heptose:LPS heptosyltransferase
VREEVESIPKSLILFDNIYSIRGGRSSKKQLAYLLLMIPKLIKNQYDVVIDLQNNKISKIARKLLFPVSWVQFDRSSSNHATERYRRTLAASGFLQPELCYQYHFIDPSAGLNKLVNAGWNQTDNLVLINPAGAFETRNWPLDNYISYCNLFLKEISPNTKFLIMGLPSLSTKAAYLKLKLGDALIDLTGKTTPAEAFHIIQKLFFVLSEDGALMHMSYLSKIPTICMIGSVRKDWTDPCLPHTFCFNSNDLPCGNCMQATCALGNNLCMIRVLPEMVIEQSKFLLDKTKSNT